MTVFKHITVAPLSGALGAEIGEVDLASGVSDDVIAEIRQALLDYLVIFFRDQVLDDKSHKAFTRQFGELFVHPNFNTGEGDPEIVRVVRAPTDASVVGEQWHADTTMLAEPPMGAILYALDVPPYGADTVFANQYLAYEALSSGMKTMLADIKAVHSDIDVAGPQAAKNARRAVKVREDAGWNETQSLHPVLSVHPETGRPCLFLNKTYAQRFDQMSSAESQPLLDYLDALGHRPEFTCRFTWQPGSIAFWDNRCTKHMAIHDMPGHWRRMQRTQIIGGPVLSAGEHPG